MSSSTWNCLGLLALLGMTDPSLARGEEPAAATAGGNSQAGPDDWWADLEKAEPFASHGLLQFAAHPPEAIAYFKTHLRPLTIEPDAVRALILDLGSNDKATWEPAFQELEYLDPRLAIDLETLMSETLESPARQRLVAVLSGRKAEAIDVDAEVNLRKTGDDSYNFFSKRGSWWAEHQVSRLRSGGFGNPKPQWTRAMRAIVLLEHFGTPEADELIETMASGHPEAEPTIVAQGALEARRQRKP